MFRKREVVTMVIKSNYISCTLTITPKMNSSKSARVIFPGGEIRQFREPTKAAELMLESPSFFLVNSRSLHIGRRFFALIADEDLEFGNVYIMFPMKRLNSIVTAGDMAVFFMAASSAAKRIYGGKVRILPDNRGYAQESATEVESQAAIDKFGESQSGGSRLNLEEIEGLSVPEFKFRMAACRSRKPLLETIREEPVCSR